MMNDEDNSDWVFDYNLSKKIEYLGKVNNSSTVETKVSGNHITGFRITIRQSSFENAERKSNNRANNLKNYLIVESGEPTNISIGSYHEIPKKNGTARVSKSLTSINRIHGAINDLDLNNDNIKSIINYSESKSLELEYLSKAIFHRYNNNPVDCIKELFKVIEKDKSFPEYEKYKVIRDIFSHRPHYQKDTMFRFLKYFNDKSFDYKRFDPDNGWITIDLESSKSRQVLGQLIKDCIKSIKSIYS
jgi:hypothetical protein